MDKAIQAIREKIETLEERFDNLKFTENKNPYQFKVMANIEAAIIELNNAIEILEANNVQS